MRDYRCTQTSSYKRFLHPKRLTYPTREMACEVAVMNPQQMDVSAMESLYGHGSWKPLSPHELGSPLYEHSVSPQGSVHSPSSVSAASSPVLSHVGSPMAAPTSYSPVHSPNSMQAAHSPIMHGSPLSAADNMLSASIVKQEQLDVELRYANDSCLSSLLRNNDMIAAQNMALAPPHMGPPHPREILDGEYLA